MVADGDDRWIGRVFLSSPAGLGHVFFHFFDVALDLSDTDQVAQALIGSAINLLAPGDEWTLLFALDNPHPWHPNPEPISTRHGVLPTRRSWHPRLLPPPNWSQPLSTRLPTMGQQLTLMSPQAMSPLS